MRSDQQQQVRAARENFDSVEEMPKLDAFEPLVGFGQVARVVDNLKEDLDNAVFWLGQAVAVTKL
jgi:hypothetical protein